MFGGILPRCWRDACLGALIAEILPHEKVSASLGPNSGEGIDDRNGARAILRAGVHAYRWRARSHGGADWRHIGHGREWT